MINLQQKLENLEKNITKDIESDTLNFLKCIKPIDNKKMSLVATYTPKFLGENFISLDENLNIIERTDFDNYYYGISPTIDTETLIQAIAKLTFTSAKGLDSFITERRNDFILRRHQSDYLLAFARYSVLSLSAKFGITINFNNVDTVQSLVYEYSQCVTTESNPNSVIIKGCPSESLLEKLKTFNYAIDANQNIIATTEAADYSIVEIYKNTENIKLLFDSIFYSGVLLRTLKIEKLHEMKANKNIVPFNINFERSTYATVYVLDNIDLSDIRLSECDKQLMSNFLFYDDKCKLNLHASFDNCSSDNESTLLNVNNYLKESFNVNQIAVSGNIVTSDNYLVMCKRSNNSIDSNLIYPSVNGNAELADKKVSFYVLSAQEDYPHTSINDDRIAFSSELTRETYAELKLSLVDEDWNCFGITLSGMIPHDHNTTNSIYPICKRRLSLYILYEQTIKQDFMSLVKTQKQATESYETKQLIGFKLDYYNSCTGFIKNAFKQIINWLLSYKTTILAFFTIAIFFTTISNWNNISFKEVNNWLATIFAVLAIITTILGLFTDIKKSLIKSSLTTNLTTINTTASINKFEKSINIFLNKNHHPHPIVRLMLLRYLQNEYADKNKKSVK